MPAHFVSIGHPRVRGRGPASRGPDRGLADLGRRLLAWASGRALTVGGEMRKPIDKPFPFFGD